MCIAYFVIIQVISLPVVVVVHGVQHSSAEATVFWDNYFSEPVSYRLLFDEPFKFFLLFRKENCLLYPIMFHGVSLVKLLVTTLNNRPAEGSMSKTFSSWLDDYKMVCLMHSLCINIAIGNTTAAAATPNVDTDLQDFFVTYSMIVRVRRMGMKNWNC